MVFFFSRLWISSSLVVVASSTKEACKNVGVGFSFLFLGLFHASNWGSSVRFGSADAAATSYATNQSSWSLWKPHFKVSRLIFWLVLVHGSGFLLGWEEKINRGDANCARGFFFLFWLFGAKSSKHNNFMRLMLVGFIQFDLFLDIHSSWFFILSIQILFLSQCRCRLLLLFSSIIHIIDVQLHSHYKVSCFLITLLTSEVASMMMFLFWIVLTLHIPQRGLHNVNSADKVIGFIEY